MKQWWFKNWRWLVVLPLAMAAALYFASGRLTQVYWQERPTALVAAQASEKGQMAMYSSQLVNSGKTYQRDIEVTFEKAHQVDSFAGLQAVDGAKLWAFDFSFSADPKVIASGCHVVVLDEAGRKYFERAATVVDPTATAFTPMDCVPAGAEGPTIDFFSGEVVDSPAPRPHTWQATMAVALPEGVSPTAVQLYWDLPNYAQFEVR